MYTKETFKKRLSDACKDAGITKKKLVQKVQAATGKSGHDLSIERLTLYAYAKNGIPPIGVIITMANILNTNVGYLLGEHAAKEVVANPLCKEIPIKAVANEYKRIFGRSLFAGGEIRRSLLTSYKSDYFTSSMLPLIKVAKVTGFTIDYCLGIIDVPFWEEAVFDAGQYDRLPGNTIFYIPADSMVGETYGILSEGKDFVIFNNGYTLPISAVKRNKAEIVIQTICGTGSKHHACF